MFNHNNNLNTFKSNDITMTALRPTYGMKL